MRDSKQQPYSPWFARPQDMIAQRLLSRHIPHATCSDTIVSRKLDGDVFLPTVKRQVRWKGLKGNNFSRSKNNSSKNASYTFLCEVSAHSCWNMDEESVQQFPFLATREVFANA